MDHTVCHACCYTSVVFIPNTLFITAKVLRFNEDLLPASSDTTERMTVS